MIITVSLNPLPLHNLNVCSLHSEKTRKKSISLFASGASFWACLNGLQIANAASLAPLMVDGPNIEEGSVNNKEKLATKSINFLGDEMPAELPASLLADSSPRRIVQQQKSSPQISTDTIGILPAISYIANVRPYIISSSPDWIKTESQREHSVLDELAFLPSIEPGLKPVYSPYSFSELLQAGWIVTQSAPATSQKLSQKPKPNPYLFNEVSIASNNVGVIDLVEPLVVAQQQSNQQTLSDSLKIEPLVRTEVIPVNSPARGNSPGLTFATPSAFGAGFGDAFFGASVSTAGKARPDIDGSMSAGIGLGSSDTLGLELSYNVGSFKRFASNGTFDVKAHRLVYAKGTDRLGVAVGLNSFAQYGNEAVVPSSLYGVVTSYSVLRPNDPYNEMPISASIGLGGGGFRQGDASTGVFAGVGVQVHPQLGVGLGWSGVGVNAGISYVPIPSIPLTIGLTGGDLTNNTAGGSVLVLNVGYGFNFLPR